ncbi:hypothetical protein CC2G_014268 [Coprinopsis cinerea AmutBmut pab1-1]|nr:hypothetical protein CC2G_014268 [Coprinopsis cinerea AmutBmut pab1-1]
MTTPPTPFAHPARGADVADVVSLTTHPLVPGREGNIYLLCGRGDVDTMQKVLNRAITTKYPDTLAEAIAEGYFIVKARDEPRFLWRNMDGDQDPMNDVLVLWTKAGDKHDANTIELLKDVRDRVHGDLGSATPDKPTFDPVTKTYSGGLAFERDAAAVPLQEMKRAYPLTISHQFARDMDAPHKARKTNGKPLDDHGLLVRDIVRAGVLAGIEGLEEGSQELSEALRTRSEYLNTPRVGDYRNAYFPAVQLNISTAVSADDVTSLHDALGQFGGNHVDCGDSAGGITAMTNLSFPHPDVAPEITYCADYKIGIIMLEFDTDMFNGLHCHGAVISRYTDHRTDPRDYFRNMVICYSPSKSFDIPGSSAQGSLPTAIGKERVWQIASEMKDWGIVSAFAKHASGQASFGIDGEAGLTGEAHFEHFVHAMLQFNAFIVNQFPPHYLMRIDKDKFLSAFTFVNSEGVRVGSKPWPLGPGWSGTDTAIGTKYEQDIRALPTDQLLRLHNSDSLSESRYGNTLVADHIANWNRHLKSQSATIPLCVASDLSGVKDFEPNPSLRRNVAKTIRKSVAAASTAVDAPSTSKIVDGKKTMGGERSTKGKEHSSRGKNRKRSSRGSGEDSGGDQDEGRRDSKRNTGADVRGKGKGKGKRRADWDGYTTSDAEYDAVSCEDEPLPRRSKRNLGGDTRTASTIHDVGVYGQQSEEEVAWREVDGPQDGAVVVARICNPRLVARTNTDISRCIQEAKDERNTLPIANELLSDLCRLLTDNDILGVWRVHSQLGAKQRSLEISSICHRGLCLTVNMVSWQWLRHAIGEAYTAFRNKEDTWLGPLIDRLDTFVLNPKKGMELRAKDLVPSMSQSDKTYVLEPLKRRVFITDTLEDYILLMEPILLAWFEFPQSPTNRVRASLCEVVVDELGIWGLFLPEMWAICRDIRSITAGQTGRFPSHKVDLWIQNFRTAFRATSASRVKTAIEEFGGALETYSLGYLSEKNLEQVRASAVRNGTSSNISEVPFTSCDIEDDHKGDAIIKYVQHVIDNGDKKLPFRDLAPSRRRILEGDGDYAIAGIVSMPTLEEMAGIIRSLDKGALKGLRALGYICDDHSSTFVALRDVHSKITSSFTPEELNKMMYNVFVLEHMLCKHGRLSTQLYRDTV